MTTTEDQNALPPGIVFRGSSPNNAAALAYLNTVHVGKSGEVEVFKGPAVITYVSVYDDDPRSGWSVNFRNGADPTNHVLFGGAGSTHFPCEVLVPSGVTVRVHNNANAETTIVYRTAQPQTP